MAPYREPGLARSIIVDHDSPVPLYRQIADGVRALIASGALSDGDELPSVRKLGAMLGVNLNTVAKAYRVLADEQVVDLRHGAAARVLAPPVATDESVDDEARRALFDVVGRMRLHGASEDAARDTFEEALSRFYGEKEGDGR
jgi:GntR family transcriptional regulator